MKLTQKKCKIKLPNTKSANALSSLMPALNSLLFAGLVCMRNDAARTNWPTVALKPARKALKGFSLHVSRWSFYTGGRIGMEVEGGTDIVSDKETVDELHSTSQHEEAKEGV